MGSRMDKYKNIDETDVPKRSDRNKELYRQIYNAYDEFENLVVPSNAKEIDLSSLKKEITSRDEYKKVKDYSDITNNKIVRKEIVQEEQRQENQIYDINELLNKAVKDNKKQEESVPTMSTDSYLKKLKLDEVRTNLDEVKEMYEDIKKETEEENEELLKTANLSLEILSDLKGDDDNTMIEAPIKDEYLPEEDNQFYSNKYKFSKKDFEDKDSDIENEDEEDIYDDEESSDNGKFFFKILLLVFGIAVVVVIAIYLISYFNRV